ncbi:tripartite tricarboxylate transporter TctB family protein [Natrialbaceae archaeon A-CW3]
MTAKHQSRLVSIIEHSSLIIVSVIIFLRSQRYAIPTTSFGPDFFPRLLAGGIALLAVLSLSKELTTEGSNEINFDAKSTKIVIVVTSITILYLLLLPEIGFIPMSIAYVGLLLYIGGVRKYIHVILIPLITTLVLYMIFIDFLRVPLPEGPISDIVNGVFTMISWGIA